MTFFFPLKIKSLIFPSPIFSLHPLTMATTPSSLLFPTLSILLLLLASSAAARPGLHFHPCKTLLISTYSVSLQPLNDPDHRNKRPELFAVVTEVREFHPKPHSLFPDGPRQPHGFVRVDQDQTLIRRPALAVGSKSSLRDRTIDVLNVLASLLFGAGCGALTAGTMFLIWSLFHSRFEAHRSSGDFSDDEDDDNDDDDDIFNPKKVHSNKDEGYVAVPAASSAADSIETALLKKEST